MARLRGSAARACCSAVRGSFLGRGILALPPGPLPLDPILDLLAVHGTVGRRGHAKPDFLVADRQDRDHHVIADDDRFVAVSRQYEHPWTSEFVPRVNSPAS